MCYDLSILLPFLFPQFVMFFSFGLCFLQYRQDRLVLVVVVANALQGVQACPRLCDIRNIYEHEFLSLSMFRY